MFYLIIAIIFSCMLSILVRISEGRIKDNIAMLAANYITCTAVAAIDVGFGSIFISQPGTGIALTLGLIGGLAYFISFVLLQYNIRVNGVVMPATFMKLGLLVPTAVSLTVFRERPELLQTAGFFLAIAAIIMINFEKGESRVKNKLSLVMLLILAGIGDLMSKLHEELGSAAVSEKFLMFLFGTACVLSVGVMLYKKQRIGRWELIFGVMVGVPNYLSSKFMLQSLKYLPAVIVFPSFSVGCIAFITVFSLIVFKEKLSGRQWFALAMITAALAMLNI